MNKYFSSKERAEQKQRSRERDEDRLRRGEITPAQLQQENLAFRGFDKKFIAIPAKYLPPGVKYLYTDRTVYTDGRVVYHDDQAAEKKIDIVENTLDSSSHTAYISDTETETGKE
jgi:hypothetical protein